MARYTGPQWKISRRLGFSILENGKELNRRAYAPGQHGQKRKKQNNNTPCTTIRHTKSITKKRKKNY